MSNGKYSPNLPNNDDYEYKFNCYGQPPAEYTPGVNEYDEKLMFDAYDEDGFDRYGYSCFDKNGVYVGTGRGIDRNGYTELQYMEMSTEDFLNCF